MNYKKSTAAILVGAVAFNAAGAGYGIKLFTELPPLAALTVKSSTASVFNTMYNAVTDERIEAPAIETIKISRS